MAETTSRWLLSLEKGNRMVAACFVVISALSTVCIVLYNSNITKQEKLNTIIYTNEAECSKRVQAVEHDYAEKFRNYQDRKDKEAQDFMKEQLNKAQNLRDNAFNVREKYSQMQQEAMKNNVKVKTLIKNEKK